MNPIEVPIAHEERFAGRSKYSMYSLIRLNFDLITGFSVVPLQLFSMVGMAVSPCLGAAGGAICSCAA
jgi:undecaprenyl-phosphate 4-deoxy-4-formamido-L-arabinose transferase